VALEAPDDVALADKLRRGRDQIMSELRKLIIGQDAVIEQSLTALYAGGNCDLDSVLKALRAEGVWVDPKVEESEYGKFGWVMDPEGNRLELWQPPVAKKTKW
jgi:hypothetical protein